MPFKTVLFLSFLWFIFLCLEFLMLIKLFPVQRLERCSIVFSLKSFKCILAVYFFDLKLLWIYLVCFHIMVLCSKDHPFSAESRWNCCRGLTVREGFGSFVIPLCTSSFHWYFWSCLGRGEHQLCCCHFIANLQIWRQACAPLPPSKLLFSSSSFMWEASWLPA